MSATGPLKRECRKSFAHISRRPLHIGFLIVFIQPRVATEKRPGRACAGARATFATTRRFLLPDPRTAAWRSPIAYEFILHICYAETSACQMTGWAWRAPRASIHTAGRDGQNCHIWGMPACREECLRAAFENGFVRRVDLQDCGRTAMPQPLAPRSAISIQPTKTLSGDPHRDGIYRIAPHDIALYIICVDEARSVFGSSVSQSTHCGPDLTDAPVYLPGPREAWRRDQPVAPPFFWHTCNGVRVLGFANCPRGCEPQCL